MGRGWGHWGTSLSVTICELFGLTACRWHFQKAQIGLDDGGGWVVYIIDMEKPISHSLLGFGYKMNQSTVGSGQKGFLQKGGILVRDGWCTARQWFTMEAACQNHLSTFKKYRFPGSPPEIMIQWSGAESGNMDFFFNMLPKWLGNTARLVPDRMNRPRK